MRWRSRVGHVGDCPGVVYVVHTNPDVGRRQTPGLQRETQADNAAFARASRWTAASSSCSMACRGVRSQPGERTRLAATRVTGSSMAALVDLEHVEALRQVARRLAEPPRARESTDDVAPLRNPAAARSPPLRQYSLTSF